MENSYCKPTRQFVIGKWQEDGSFKPLTKQPEEPITELNKMVAWARATLKDTTGEYDLILKLPGKLIIATQTKLNLKFE